MNKPGTTAELHLDGRPVGTVVLRHVQDSWHFGDFIPNDTFSQYAPRYARWAMLLHEDEARTVTRDLSDELRAAENDLMSIRAKLFFAEKREWRRLGMVTIDGHMIEWKEF